MFLEHIHRLFFFCCYVCSAKETKLPVWSVSNKNTFLTARTTKRVRIGVEFSPDDGETVEHKTTQQQSRQPLQDIPTQDGTGWNPGFVAPQPQAPLAIHFRYSSFGAKIVFPLVTITTPKKTTANSSGDRPAGAEEEEAVTFELPCGCGNNSNADLREEQCEYEQKAGTGFYFDSSSSLRKAADKYIVPCNTKWNKSCLRTIRNGVKACFENVKIFRVYAQLLLMR